LKAITERLPSNINYKQLLGGLAPDSSEPMPESMRTYIQDNWRRIEESVPDVHFNYEFWSRCEPVRSTYPACRSVIAARNQGSEYEFAMTIAIQNAYYQSAKNPSEQQTLVTIACEMGLDEVQFEEDLNASDTQTELLNEIALARSMGVSSFPSLVLEVNGGFSPIPHDYQNAQNVLAILESVAAS
jgi:putative protein-disulfide isomerase